MLPARKVPAHMEHTTMLTLFSYPDLFGVADNNLYGGKSTIDEPAHRPSRKGEGIREHSNVLPAEACVEASSRAQEDGTGGGPLWSTWLV